MGNGTRLRNCLRSRITFTSALLGVIQGLRSVASSGWPPITLMDAQNALRALVAALVVTLLGPARAYAAQGSLSIESKDNEGVSYDAYCVFLADISYDDTATHVSWASDATRDVVLPFLDGNGYQAWLDTTHPNNDCHDTAQVALEYIAQQIGLSNEDAGAATSPRTTQGRSFANELARALASSGRIKTEEAPADKEFVAEQGFWLFVSQAETISALEGSGTAPIWVALGGSAARIVEKTSLPSLEKQVKDDASDTWSKTADAHRGQALSYRLTGTLPNNFGAFAHYHYCISDTLSKGLSLSVPQGGTLKDALTITIDGKPVKASENDLLLSYDQGILVIDFVDLKDGCWDTYHISQSSTIAVEYQAHLNDACAAGASGTINEAHLTYTTDPISEQESSSKTSVTRAFTYALELRKQDSNNGKPLAGARFTLAVADNNAGQQSRGLYVQGDGSLAKRAYVHTSDADGTIHITGLDEGSYVIHETSAPDGYQELKGDIRLTISAQRGAQDLSLASLSASTDSDAATIDEVKPDAGLVILRIENRPRARDSVIEPLAQTGVGPVAGALVACGCLAIALAHHQKSAQCTRSLPRWHRPHRYV